MSEADLLAASRLTLALRHVTLGPAFVINIREEAP